MKESYKKIFDFLYGPFFAVLDFFMRNYKANRDRLDNVLSSKKVSSFLQGLAVILLIIWIIIFSFAPDEKRNELTQQIKQGFEKYGSADDK